MQIRSDSRYKFTPIINHNGQLTFGSWVKPPFLSKPDTWATYTVPKMYEGKAGLISNDFYGTSDYWWVLVAANQAVDINWPRAGDVIKVPLIESIQRNY